jgi:hypothetical protein
MPKVETIPTDAAEFRRSFNLMENQRRAGKDPWNGHGRGLQGFASYYKTTFNVTSDEADHLASRLLAVLCGTDDA